MNFILWFLSGGLIGSFVAWFFAGTIPHAVGDFSSSVIGSIIFGLIAAEYMPDSSPIDLDQQAFSPGTLVMATLGAIIFITLYNVYFL
ncbi:MAG: hypothetical protein KW802_03690 [Candidatus Doudnabacteria bacterium]|nr:hypothetical protein [Candidatus Doudnabacteria bacterium]